MPRQIAQCSDDFLLSGRYEILVASETYPAAIGLTPFLVLALTIVLGAILGPADADLTSPRSAAVPQGAAHLRGPAGPSQQATASVQELAEKETGKLAVEQVLFTNIVLQ